MELTDRQTEIVELVREQGFVSVDALSDRFDVSTQTIRRDLTTLCDHGLARRRHGGIELPTHTENISYKSRQVLARAAKLAIGREVARHVGNGASLAFSIGTTPQVAAEALLQHRELRIFTNNLNIAVARYQLPLARLDILRTASGGARASSR